MPSAGTNAPPAERVRSFQDARHAVEQHAKGVRPSGVELADLLHSAGRVLAEEIRADRDFPPFSRATRDGYAVRAADLMQVPTRLNVVGEIRAGASSEESAITLNPSETVEIMTGAPVPADADAVVMVEYTQRQGGWVKIERGASAGENVVPRGAEGRAGDVLLRAGTRLSPAAIAVAASVGKWQISVYRRPRVAILSTGDEVVDVASEPGPNQIRNSNSYSLAAQVERAGGVPVVLPIAPDEHDSLLHLVREGLSSELLLLTGGVSMGKYDLVEQILLELGAEFYFTGAQIQPGRPVVFGRAAPEPEGEPAYFFGLPGNPVSTMVTFELFARAMVEALAGATLAPLRFLQARLKSEVKTKTGLTRFLPATLSGEFEACEVRLAHWQGSGDIAATARADCFLVVPPDRERIAAGEMVSVLIAQ